MERNEKRETEFQKLRGSYKNERNEAKIKHQGSVLAHPDMSLPQGRSWIDTGQRMFLTLINYFPFTEQMPFKSKGDF